MQVFEYDSLDSTNLEARRLWQMRSGNKNAPQPIAVIAATQTAGMGRERRTWQSPKGGLWLSVAWPLQNELETYQALPLAVGLAVVQTLEDLYGLKGFIKWPNDVLIGRKKLVGILCQGEPGLEVPAIIIGIGINGNYSAATLGHQLRQTPTTLCDEMGHSIDLIMLREHLLGTLNQTLEHYEQGDWTSQLLGKVADRLAWRGSRVRCSDINGQLIAAGILESLAPNGGIKIRTAEGLQTLASGELQLVDA